MIMMPGAVVLANDSNHLTVLKMIVKWAVVKPNLGLALSCFPISV